MFRGEHLHHRNGDVFLHGFHQLEYQRRNVLWDLAELSSSLFLNDFETEINVMLFLLHSCPSRLPGPNWGEIDSGIFCFLFNYFNSFDVQY